MEITKEIQAQIDEAKSNNCLVRKVKICGSDYVYRSITRKEWVDLQKELENTPEEKLTKNLGEELMVKRFVIASERDASDSPAGVMAQIAELILALSGFGQIESVPEEL